MAEIDCFLVAEYDPSVWGELKPVSLVDTLSGGPVRQPTSVKVCRDQQMLRIRFECDDDFVVSRFSQRDEPLYEQDVVEVFIDEEGSGKRYIELEVSPNNVIFDAVIHFRGGIPGVHAEWDMEGLTTSVLVDGNRRIYDVALPLDSFMNVPAVGTVWRVNFYRIDEDAEGRRQYQAWSPTGAIDSHVPCRFGTMRFRGEPEGGRR